MATDATMGLDGMPSQAWRGEDGRDERGELRRDGARGTEIEDGIDAGVELQADPPQLEANTIRMAVQPEAKPTQREQCTAGDRASRGAEGRKGECVIPGAGRRVL